MGIEEIAGGSGVDAGSSCEEEQAVESPDFVHESTPAQPTTKDAALEIADLLLRGAVGDSVPSGPLGFDTVPSKLLALPIAIATADLVEHRKRCKNHNCGFFPPSLVRYTRMRPQAIRSAPEDVNKALWLYPTHELVKRVKSRILSKEVHLATQVRSGDLFGGEQLRPFLAGGEPAVLRLAATLWALEFAPSGSEMLFRLLAPLVHAGNSSNQRATDFEPRLTEAKKELRRVQSALEKSERQVEELSRRLHAKEKSFERVKPDLEEARAQFARSQEQLNASSERTESAFARIRALEGERERATKISALLRVDLRCQQDELRALDVERADLARKLASGRRALENIERRLESAPTGALVVHNFLNAEAARISEDRLILSGGAKTRAEQEWTAHRKLEKAFLDTYPLFREPPPRKIRPKNALRLVPLGGSSEVGRSCYLLELGEYRLLVDCGIKPSSKGDLLPAIDNLTEVDGLILTHVHTDHVGWLPALVRRFPKLSIYCSDGTAALLPVVLEDCHQHYMRKLAKRRHDAQLSRSDQEIGEDYDATDVNRIIKLAITCDFDQKETLFGEVSATFFKAGHILGAASVLVEDQSGRRIFMSGDFSSFPQLTVQAARWPDEIGDVDLLVLESTYGNRARHEPFDESRAKLLEFIRETAAAGGSVILASFAIGRAQELIKFLVTAKKNGELPDLPIHVDGMIKRVNPIYRRFADFDVDVAAINEVSGDNERQEVVAAAQSHPVLIVTTSGMLAGGPVVEYCRQLLPDPRHRIVLTGYQDETAPSKVLTDITSTGRTARVVRLEDERGEKVEFEAAMPAKEFKLSAHADRAGLVEYSTRMRPQYIALVHGETDSQRDLSHFLASAHPRAEIVCGPDSLVVP